ncbi:MAG: chemotaxis protein CheW [Leptospiraceae bacterium]|nr:chemotaxis protein CheW [Leptospiraceae bacterium]MDW7976262.1 chemotaxis protein CheW [Leptospiraceae bacterium]
MPSTLENKYVIFTLDEEEYGFSVEKVIEIVKMEKVIPIPNSKEYFMGMVDIRGKVIPAIDLKKKLQIHTESSQKPERLIIIDIFDKRIALAVDNVLNVLDLLPDEIDKGPPAVKSHYTKYISGIGKKNDRFIVMLNINTLFTEEELRQLITIGS